MVSDKNMGLCLSIFMNKFSVYSSEALEIKTPDIKNFIFFLKSIGNIGKLNATKENPHTKFELIVTFMDAPFYILGCPIFWSASTLQPTF